MEKLARSVWRIGSGRPRVAVLGGVHGNELAGVQALHRLFDRLSTPAVPLLRGELLLAEGNWKAIGQNVRFVDLDLNRCFDRQLSRSIGLGAVASSWATTVAAGAGAHERDRAFELAPFLANLDVLLDLHATNKPSVPFARLPGPVDDSYLRSCEHVFLRFLPLACSTILWDPQQCIADGAMTDEFAMRHAPQEGGAYICYEAGQASDVSAVDDLEFALLSMLHGLDMLPREAYLRPTGESRRWSQFEIMRTFSLDEQGFEWTNGHGEASFDKVPTGQAFGRRLASGEELFSEEEAYIVFPKVKHLWGVGRPLGWLARRLDDVPAPGA